MSNQLNAREMHWLQELVIAWHICEPKCYTLRLSPQCITLYYVSVYNFSYIQGLYFDSLFQYKFIIGVSIIKMNMDRQEGDAPTENDISLTRKMKGKKNIVKLKKQDATRGGNNNQTIFQESFINEPAPLIYPTEQFTLDQPQFLKHQENQFQLCNGPSVKINLDETSHEQVLKDISLDQSERFFPQGKNLIEVETYGLENHEHSLFNASVNLRSKVYEIQQQHQDGILPTQNYFIPDKAFAFVPVAVDFISEVQRLYNNDPEPESFGNIRAYNYTGESGTIGREPRITLGKRWWLSLLLLLLIDATAIVIIVLTNHLSKSWLFAIGILTLICQNLNFLFLIVRNPGFPNRDPRMHTSQYLDKARFINRTKVYCQTCKVIFKENIPTRHCDQCGFCIEGWERHCGWLGKCIGRNNKVVFKNAHIQYIQMIFLQLKYIFNLFTYLTVGLLVYLVAASFITVQVTIY